MVLVTNMASDVAPYVELVSRHTTLKIAGIDNNVVSPETYFKLKNEAHIIIISIDILIDWFTRCISINIIFNGSYVFGAP